MQLTFRQWWATWSTPVFISLVLGVAGLLLWTIFRLTPEEIHPPVVQPAPGVITIQVPHPVLTERVVTKYVPVEDRSQVIALLNENADLKISVEQLSVSLAKSTSQGQGLLNVPATRADAPDLPAFTFRDWRLAFTGQGTSASYTLTQQFSVVNSVGTNHHGVPTQLIRVYEIGPNQERWPVPVTETVTVAATPATEGWYVKPTMQAGFSFLVPVANPGTALRQAGGVIAVPWLKYGTTRSVEDTRWAFLTPSLTASGNTSTVGLLPVSFNLGSLPRQPFSDIWVSPFIGGSPATLRAGITLTVTF